MLSSLTKEKCSEGKDKRHAFSQKGWQIVLPMLPPLKPPLHASSPFAIDKDVLIWWKRIHITPTHSPPGRPSGKFQTENRMGEFWARTQKILALNGSKYYGEIFQYSASGIFFLPGDPAWLNNRFQRIHFLIQTSTLLFPGNLRSYQAPKPLKDDEMALLQSGRGFPPCYPPRLNPLTIQRESSKGTGARKLARVG